MSQDEDLILQVSDLKVTLEGRAVVANLSFVVRRGEVMTILGPNGAGKTVLLRALLGTVPYEGSITWKKGTRIGYVPQRLPYIKDTPSGRGLLRAEEKRWTRRRRNAPHRGARGRAWQEADW